MLKSINRLILSLIMMATGQCFAQEGPNIKFKNYGIPEGLSMSTVFDIAQTSDGYIWVATADGLNRFDGYEFKVYKNIPKDKNSLQENYITALETDDKGNLWVGTNGGFLGCFNTKTQKYIRKPLLIQDGKQNSSNITDIFWDKERYIWVGTEANGLIRIDSNSLYNYTTKNSNLSSDYVLNIHKELGSNNLWLGVFNGLNCLNYSNLTIKDKVLLSGGSVLDITQRGDTLIASTQENGRFLFVDDKRISMSEFDQTMAIMDFHIDRNGNEWLGLFKEGLKVHLPTGKYLEFKHSTSKRNSLVNDVVLKIFEDKTGNIWIGTLSGLSLYSPIIYQFGQIGAQNGNITGLLDENVYYVYESLQGDIWFCTYNGGISKLNLKTKKVINYDISNTKGLANNSTNSLLQEDLDNYWVGSANGGLYLFNEKKKEFKEIQFETTPAYIRSLEKSNDNLLWVGGLNGLFSYKIDEKETFQYDDLRLENIYKIVPLKDENKLLIASFNHGLMLFDIETKKVVKQYLHSDEDSLSISNNSVMCITPWSKDSYVVGTYGGGFSVFNYTLGTFNNYGIKDGLSNEAIYGVLKDERFVWLSSNKGLSRFNLLTNEVKNYDNISQVQSLEFNEGAFFKSTTGVLYFGGINGVNYFNPSNLKENKVKPYIIIQKVKIFEEDFPFEEGLINENKVLLTYQQNFVGFEFAAINYSNPEKCTYSYMLEGVDKDWVQMANSRYAKYTNLGPGEYVFSVKASNEDGVWSEVETITIEIASPFWRKAWFLILCGIVLAGIITFIILQRTKRLKNKYNLKVLDMELKALRSQMNPHFIFNSINSIQYYILNKNPKTAYAYLSKFSTLMRLILNNSRVDFITMKEEVEALNIYLELEKMRLEDELEYHIEVENNITQDKTLIPSMIIQPYVENSILHGLAPKEGNRRLDIKMKKTSGQIYCIIEDNGIGRHKAKELNENRTRKHSSAGMKVTKGRLELLNQGNLTNLSVAIKDLKDSHGEARGTRVEIYIPFKDKNDND